MVSFAGESRGVTGCSAGEPGAIAGRFINAALNGASDSLPPLRLALRSISLHVGTLVASFHGLAFDETVVQGTRR
jgi:hypothetical protein